MKLLSWVGLFLFLMLVCFADTSDAFSRRSSHSEMGPITSGAGSPSTADRTSKSTVSGLEVSATAVPEPPVLWLMSLGIGLLAGGVLVRGLHRSAGSSR